LNASGDAEQKEKGEAVFESEESYSDEWEDGAHETTRQCPEQEEMKKTIEPNMTMNVKMNKNMKVDRNENVNEHEFRSEFHDECEEECEYEMEDNAANGNEMLLNCLLPRRSSQSRGGRGHYLTRPPKISRQKCEVCYFGSDSCRCSPAGWV
jgi:hypothetical protein